MAEKGWNNLGKDLNRIIEDAVQLGNFGHLNDTINNTVRKAFQTFESGDGSRGYDGWEFNLSGQKPQASTQQNSENAAANAYKYGARTYGKPQAAYFAGSWKRRSGAVVMLVSGIFLLLFGVVPLSLGLFDLFFSVITIAGIFLTVKGSTRLKLARRFDQYVRSLNGNAYGDIKMLANYTRKSENFVVKDIKKMLDRGWFLQGHLDDREKCLMVSHEAYEQYMKAVKGVNLQEEEAQRRREEEEKRNAGLTPEAKDVIEKGREYIEQIKMSNDAIPGEEVSEKIYRMELLIKRIFEQVETHPENVSDLRKLMEYYLPMTIKLLKAYEELDQQPIQSDNIASSKKEIEETLDTLNKAFEKLLDNLFQDTVVDVSSDISVLQTMLAQEGLTEDGFSKK